MVALYDSTLAVDGNFDTGAGGFSGAYAHLKIIAQLRTKEAAIISAATLTFNNDGGANYDAQDIKGRNTTATVADAQGGTSIILITAGANAAAGVFGALEGTIPNYAGTVAEKSLIWSGGFADEAATGGDAGVRTAHWRSTAAISRIILAGSGGGFLAGSRLSVYGIG